MEFTSASARRVALLAAIALHVIAVIIVLQLRPAPASLRPPEPLIVRWIEPEPIKPPPPPTQPKPQPPKPAVKRVEPPVTPKPVTPLPPLITTEAAPAAQPFVAPPAVPAPPEPAPAPAVTMTAAPKVAEGPPVPLPITPPSFDAAYLNNPAPPYPSAARRLGEAGRVVLRVLVTPGGTPEQVEVRTSSKSPRLDEAAMRAVQRWKFVPARQGERPVSAWVLVPIVFTLEG